MIRMNWMATTMARMGQENLSKRRVESWNGTISGGPCGVSSFQTRPGQYQLGILGDRRFSGHDQDRRFFRGC